MFDPITKLRYNPSSSVHTSCINDSPQSLQYWFLVLMALVIIVGAFL